MLGYIGGADRPKLHGQRLTDGGLLKSADWRLSRAGHTVMIMGTILWICGGSIGQRRRDMSFAIGIASMVSSSSGAFEQWAYGIGRLRDGRHGRTDMRR